MKTLRAFSIGAIALGCLLVAVVASSDDMAVMDMSHMDMSGSHGSMKMGPPALGSMANMANHMRMTELRPMTPDDEARARNILEELRSSLGQYRNYRVALMQGMHIFLPQVPQDDYHFTDYNWTNEEYRGHYNYRHPGSLLYTKNADGFTLIGAMFSAPPDATMDDLNSIVPLSVARWHVHTNICLPNGITIDDLMSDNIGAEQPGLPGFLPIASNPNAAKLNREYGVFADGRFGFEGKIYTAKDCSAAGGHLVEQAFGWMVHVYPFSGDDLKVAYGMDVPKLIDTSTHASR